MEWLCTLNSRGYGKNKNNYKGLGREKESGLYEYFDNFNISLYILCKKKIWKNLRLQIFLQLLAKTAWHDKVWLMKKKKVSPCVRLCLGGGNGIEWK